MKISVMLIFMSVLLTSLASLAVRSEQNLSDRLTCQFVEPIQKVFINQHINHNTEKKRKVFNRKIKEIEKKIADQYLKRLDPTEIYLLSSDEKKIRQSLSGILRKVEDRDCETLHKIHKIYVQRVEDRVKFAKKVLGEKFVFNKDTKLVLDPDHRERAKNIEEANQFQEKYIQFQISNIIAGEPAFTPLKAGKKLSAKEKKKRELERAEKLKDARSKIVRRYKRQLKRVKSQTKEDLYSVYLDAFAHTLDPHSSYFSADAMEDFRITMALSLEGIGATLSSDDGFTVIEQLIPGGAAARDGRLQPKDKIVAVGQGSGGGEKSEKFMSNLDDVFDMDLRDVVKKIRGKKGSKVRLKIVREEDGVKTNFTIALTRDKVKLEDDAAQISYINKKVGDKKLKVGLINLPSFYSDSRAGGRTAAEDVAKLLEEAQEKKADALVLDFSSNGGGSLDDAVKIAGLFFKTGNVVKQSANKRGQETILKDNDKTVNWSGPLVVLTSRISASASEIVAGTLKDYKRAVVVGADHTFGKGSIQSVIPLPSGLGAAKVTVGMFYIPGGNSTQHRGVEADVVLPSALSTEEIGEKTLDHSLPPTSLASFISKDAYVEEGKGKWTPVSSAEIEQLKSLSQVRVQKSEDFKKIVEELKEPKKENHIVNLAESFEERVESKEKQDKVKKDKNGNRDKEDKLAEYLKRADVQEALNVAADLAGLRKGINRTAKTSQP